MAFCPFRLFRLGEQPGKLINKGEDIMKKRILSMILALSMVLSILPVSAFADAGAGLPSAAAGATNSITYSSEKEHEDVGTNAATLNQVVKIKFGTDGLPKAASGTGWSYNRGMGLYIAGAANATTEYVLDGTVRCTVLLSNASGATVHLLDGTVQGKLRISASSPSGVCVLDGSYADAELYTGTVEGGIYDKMKQYSGQIKGGYFYDISGLSADTQQQAHQLTLPEGCTLNGQPVTGDVYMLKLDSEHNMKLEVQSASHCEGWAVATTSKNGGVFTLPAGITDYNFTYGSMTIASISISTDGTTLSASVGMIPMSGNAPMKLVQIPSMSKELSFTSDGLPDLTDVACVESLDEGEYKLKAYLCRSWTYVCYPNMPNSRGILTMADQGGRGINFKELNPAPINCAVQLTNATVTDAAFGKKGALVLTSGKITGGIYPDASVGVGTTGNTGKVEITGGTFDSLSCAGECTISNAVILDCTFRAFFGEGKFTVSDTVFGELPDDIETALATGQKLSKLTVRNGNVTAIAGRELTPSVNTIYLVGAGTADITLDTDVVSINDDEELSNYNKNTSAEGRVLHITGNNDGKDILVNKPTDIGAVKPLRITSEGLPDRTGVEPKKVSGEGREITLYEGLGWKYATAFGKAEDGVQRTESMILITSPDGNPVDLYSREINPTQAALKSDGITLQDVTVTNMYADAPVKLDNAVIKGGSFLQEVSLDETSTIDGGVFDATVKLRDNAKITGGVFKDITLPSNASEAAVIRDAVIMGSLTGNNSKAAVSDTVSFSRIDSAYLAAGQQQSELRNMDGVVTEIGGIPVAEAAAVYCIGNVGMVLTFSKPVTNINGKPVNAYAGASLYADGKTLALSVKNDSAPIVINQTDETAEKLPFESLTKDDFDINMNEDGTYTVKCKTTDGVGELSTKLECITGKNKGKTFINRDPDADVYGRYQGSIVAKEGEKYKAGSIDLGEKSLRYTPVAADFTYNAANKTVEYNTSANYYDADPDMRLMYAPEGTTNYNVATPTDPGRYDVYVFVNGDQNYNSTLTEKVDTFVVAGTSKPTFTVTVYGDTTEIKEYAVDEDVTIKAPPAKEGCTFAGWYAAGVPDGTDTTSETISFKMPAKNVTLSPIYDEITVPAQKFFVFVKGGKDAEYSVGEDVSIKAPPAKEGFTFTHWEADCELEDADLTKETITFKMPANNVKLTPCYEMSKYTLTIKDENGENKKVEQHFKGDLIEESAPFAEDGYTFTGWKVEGQLPDGTDTSSAKISFRMPGNNVTLTPQYAKKYRVTVNGLTQGSYFKGEDVTIEAPKYEGLTFAGWVHTEGLPDGTDTTGDTITFKMPDRDVTVYANLIPTPPTPDPEPETFALKVTNAQITLQDGTEVADLNAVPVGTELVVTADEKEGFTFNGWKTTEGLPAGTDTTGKIITFTMPDNDVTIEADLIPNPAPDPKPDPDPNPNPTPDPDPNPNPTPDPDPNPNPTPDPDPNPNPTPNPDPTPTPTPDPEPTPDPDPAPAPSDDGSGAVIVAATAVGGAAVGVGAYMVGTTVYLKSVLPEGVAIPANRQQLAVALWTAAGKPATQSTALFNDVAADAAELQAIRWAVDTGLMTAQDGSFHPGSRVSRWEVIRTWKSYQKRG